MADRRKLLETLQDDLGVRATPPANRGLYRDSGEEHGSYSTTIGYILGESPVPDPLKDPKMEPSPILLQYYVGETRGSSLGGSMLWIL